MSTSSAPCSTTQRTSSSFGASGVWPDGNAVATDATCTLVSRSRSTATGTRFGYTHTAATDGIARSVGSGRTAFEQRAATLPGVSAPSSVVRSVQRIARSSANSFASRLIDRLASSPARPSTATWSTEPIRGSRGSSGSSNPRGSAGACAMGASVRSGRVAAKNALLGLLGRIRLLEPSYRGYERVRAARAPLGPEVAAQDGLPVPPPHLIVRVAGTPDASWFLESGRLAARSITEVLERADTPIESFDSMLDF